MNKEKLEGEKGGALGRERGVSTLRGKKPRRAAERATQLHLKKGRKRKKEKFC